MTTICGLAGGYHAAPPHHRTTAPPHYRIAGAVAIRDGGGQRRHRGNLERDESRAIFAGAVHGDNGEVIALPIEDAPLDTSRTAAMRGRVNRTRAWSTGLVPLESTMVFRAATVLP